MDLCRSTVKLVLVGLLAALAACSAPSSPQSETGPVYTCCDAADVNTEYRPGQTVTIHWTVGPVRANTVGATQPVELRARLTGPYPTVSDLKANADNPSAYTTYAADPVRPTGQAGEQPMSIIALPPSAEPGYYNLVTSVVEPGGSAGGASIIHVIPAT